MAPRKPQKPARAPLGAVAAEWLEQARTSAPWTFHELTALEVAAQHLDRAEKAREQVEREGMTTTNSRGSTVGHPLLSFEVTNRAAWTKLARELGLIGGTEAEDGHRADNELARLRSVTASYGERVKRGQS